MCVIQLFPKIINNPQWHGKWLNTLSFLENCGARKIASCEHPTLVKEEMLKHAAEEFRHAHYLKRQIDKIYLQELPTYSLENILGGFHTWHYLEKLNIKACRYLSQSLFWPKSDVKVGSYLFVTYAIELRAAELYPVYDSFLRTHQSKITVKSILLEEKEHLHEMKNAILKLKDGLLHAEKICAFEQELYENWMKKVCSEIFF